MVHVSMMKQQALGLILTAGLSACGPTPTLEKAVDWTPARIAFPPSADLSARVDAPGGRPVLGKYSLRFYQRLKAKPTVVALAEVDVWDLRHHPRRYDVITIGPVSIRQFRNKTELLDQLATTHGLSQEKAQVLTNWVRTGGVVWVELGVFIQGHEWIEKDNAKMLPPLPDLKGFTIFGLPTRTYTFEATRRGAFAIEPAVFTFRNEATHEAAADVKILKLVQSDLKTVYAIIDTDQAQPLVRESGRVYAAAVPFGQGKIISTLPFDEWGVETDGEKYRVNLFEWLAGYPIPTFDPKLDIERAKD